jgi:TrmH family RNA methyltransferase
MLTSPANDRVKLVQRLQAQRRARENERLFVAEGVRLVEEAALSGTAIDFVFYCNPDERAQGLLDRLARGGVTLLEVSPAVMGACADTEHPQPLLAVLPFPAIAPSANSLLLICDGLSDPGNLGTLLRTAAAAHVDSALLAPGSVDPYNPKVVRGSMGAHFRIPIEPLSWADIRLRTAGLKVWLAEAAGGVRYDEVDWTEPSALIIGSEAEGPSAEARGLAAHSVFIPMPGGSESLNAAVAGSVILFEAVRQLLSPRS